MAHGSRTMRLLGGCVLVACSLDCGGATSEPTTPAPTPARTARRLTADPKPEDLMYRCLDNDAHACSIVGWRFLTGSNGFPRDDPKAKDFLDRACTMGDPQGCGDLGKLLMAGGNGVAKDEAKGAELVIASCERGHPWSCLDAAYALLDGRGTAADYEHATLVLKNGCDKGAATVCTYLKDLQGSGEFTAGVPPTGGGGFSFGATDADSKKRCKEHAHRFTAGAKGSPLRFCDGTLSGPPFAVVLRDCEARLCGVALVDALPGAAGSALVRRFRAHEQDLRQKYGAPHTRDWHVPKDCEADAKFAGCLTSGKISVYTRWLWKEGHAVTVRLAADADKGTLVAIEYESPAAASTPSTR